MYSSIPFSWSAVLLILAWVTALPAQEPTFELTQLTPNNFLRTPWDMEYGPQGNLWVTERETGKVLRVNPETGLSDLLITVPNVYADSRQDGLLGLALHPEIAGDSAFVYLSYTYRASGERHQRIVRYTYEVDGTDGQLTSPVTLIENLPASDDHNSGRLIFGPDGKLYYTIGDQGGNQNRNYCNPILSQMLPTQAEIDAEDWSNYPGKVLRLNTDGSIPEDNPPVGNVRSHIFTYGHRNPQGIVFGSNGLLYSDEHGPNTDDEVNLLSAGMNYGWPRVVGFRDDQAYDYCNWSSLEDCQAAEYENGDCPEGATFLEESSFVDSNYQEPLFSLFSVTDDYNYNNPACQNAYTCRPNVAPASIGIYESDAIPGWKNSLLVVSLKRGKVYRLQLNEAGTAITGDTTEYFYTQNRYRDVVVSPDGKSIYLITDEGGNITDQSGLNLASGVRNPGTILRFALKESVSTDNQLDDKLLSVWPNPVKDRLYVDLQRANIRAVRATLTNLSGQTVILNTELHSGINALSLGDLPPGVYTLKLNARNGYWVRKVVIR